MSWIDVTQEKDKRRAIVNAGMIHRIS